MSLSPVEIESLAPHVPRMQGHVVIAGLGIGLALYNALLRRAARVVTVVERNPDVIALFEAIRDPDWPSPTASRSSRPMPGGGLPSRSTTSTPILGQARCRRKPPPTRVRCAAICGLNRLGIGAWRPISSLCWLATGAKPPVTRPQFRAWASILGVPIAAYANRAWLSRIPDIATQMVFGCSPGLNVSASG